MLSWTWLRQAIEWVLFAAVTSLAGCWAAVTAGQMSWSAAWLVVGGAAVAMLGKCMGSSLKGSPESPALVEPPPQIRVVTPPAVRRPGWSREDYERVVDDGAPL